MFEKSDILRARVGYLQGLAAEQYALRHAQYKQTKAELNKALNALDRVTRRCNGVYA